MDFTLPVLPYDRAGALLITQKGQKEKVKSTLLSILWRPSLGIGTPLSAMPRITEGYRAQTQLDPSIIHTTPFLTQLVADPSFVSQCLAQDLICPESPLDGWLNAV